MGQSTVTVEVEVTGGDRTAEFHVPAGHLPVDARPRAVEALFRHPDVRVGEHVTVTVPLGDSQLLEELRGRARAYRTRAAGASCIVDIDLPGGDVE